VRGRGPAFVLLVDRMLDLCACRWPWMVAMERGAYLAI